MCSWCAFIVYSFKSCKLQSTKQMAWGYDPEIHFRSSLSTHIVKIPFAIIPIIILAIRSQLCICHKGSLAKIYAYLWPDWICIFHLRATSICLYKSSVSERWDLHDSTVIYAGRNLNIELLCNLLPLQDGIQVAYWGNQCLERSLFDSKYSAVPLIKWQIFSKHSRHTIFFQAQKSHCL